MRWRDQSGPTRAPRAERPDGPASATTAALGVLVDSLRKLVPDHRAGGHRRRRLPARRRPRRCSRAACWARRAATASTATSSSTSATSAASTASSCWAARSATSSARTSVAELCARLAPLPLASVAMAPPGVPSLLVDEEPGMRQALEHLDRPPRLPPHRLHPRARRQRRGRAPLRGLPARCSRSAASSSIPSLVCEGTFEKPAGEAAVELLVDERKVSVRRAGRVERLHGAGRDPGAAGARPARSRPTSR